jgi:predicted phosphodiesterase
MSKLPAIFVVSDLHLNTGPFEWPEAAYAADLIIVAGDLDNGVFDIEFLKKPNKPLVFVPGNHDFWEKKNDKLNPRDLFDIYADMKRAAAGSQVHVLWDETVELAGVRIIGTPLWTDFGGGNEQLMLASFLHSNDYRYINARSWYENPENLALHEEKKHLFSRFNQPDSAETGAFTPLIAYTLHQKSRAYIEDRLEEDYDGLTILVTHMAPSYECLAKSGTVSAHYLDPKNWECRGRDNSDLARVAGYASNLTPLFEQYRKKLDLAVHGHIHSTLDITCGSTRVVCNPRGRYSGPLTEDSARLYSVFGYPIGQEQVERSQATFREYPYWGDNWNFDPKLLVRLEEGLAPAIRPLVEKAMPELEELRAELLELQPHVAHRVPAIRRSIHESIASRVDRFAKVLEQALLPACDAFDTFSLGNSDWWGCLNRLGLPVPKVGLRPRFLWPVGEGRKLADMAQGMADALTAVDQLLQTLPLLPDVAELARQRYVPRIAEAVQLVASKGFTPNLVLTAPEHHWRKLYFDLGAVYVEGVEDDIVEVTREVDHLINDGVMPRQAYLAVRVPYRPRPIGQVPKIKLPGGEW